MSKPGPAYNWSPGPLMAATTITQTTYMAATTGPFKSGGTRARARARGILISTYESHTDAGRTILGGGPPMA